MDERTPPEPRHSREELRALLHRELGSPVRERARVQLGVMNLVYAARLANGLECFVKLAPAGRGEHRLREEVWAFKRCRAAGVPTPEVLAFDPAPPVFPEAYHITRRIPGENGLQAKPGRDERLDALRQLGHYLSLIHSIQLSGFGYLQPTAVGGYAGRYSTLWENVRWLLDSAPWWEPLLRDGLMTDVQLAALRNCFEEHRALFDSARSCLVYADGGLKNLIVNGGRVVGLVDMENVVAGEAVNDFDALEHDGEEEFAAVREGYGRPELFDEAFFRKLTLYRLLFAFPRLAFYHRRGDAPAMAETRRLVRALALELGIA